LPFSIREEGDCAKGACEGSWEGKTNGCDHLLKQREGTRSYGVSWEPKYPPRSPGGLSKERTILINKGGRANPPIEKNKRRKGGSCLILLWEGEVPHWLTTEIPTRSSRTRASTFNKLNNHKRNQRKHPSQHRIGKGIILLNPGGTINQKR